MTLEELLKKYSESDNIQQIQKFLSGGEGDVHLSGLVGSQDAFIASAVFKTTEYNHFFILSDKEEAAYFQNNLKSLLNNKDVFFFPDSFKRPQDFSELNNNNILLRTETVNRLSNPNSRAEMAVTYPEALLEKVVKAEELQGEMLRMKVNEKLDIDFVIDLLVGFNFERVDFVYEPGQFSIRGDIVDIYSFGNEYPYRVELFGEEIESIRTFDPLSQLSVKKIASVTIVPNIQTHFTNEKKTSLLDVFPPNTVIWIKDGTMLMDVMNMAMEKASKYKASVGKAQLTEKHPLAEGNPEAMFLSSADFMKGISRFRVIEFGNQSFFKTENKIRFHSKPQPSFNKNFDLLISNLQKNEEQGYTNLVFAENEKQVERFYAIFEDLRAKIQWQPVHVGIHQGFIDDDLKVAFFTYILRYFV